MGIFSCAIPCREIIYEKQHCAGKSKRQKKKQKRERVVFFFVPCVSPKTQSSSLRSRVFSVGLGRAKGGVFCVCVPTVCCCCLCHTLPSASSVLVWWTALSGKITAFSLASIRPTYRHSLIFECFTRRRSEIMNALRPLGRSFVFCL